MDAGGLKHRVHYRPEVHLQACELSSTQLQALVERHGHTVCMDCREHHGRGP